MKKIEKLHLVNLSVSELEIINGGTAIEGSYSAGYAIGWILGHLTFRCYYAL